MKIVHTGALHAGGVKKALQRIVCARCAVSFITSMIHINHDVLRQGAKSHNRRLCVLIAPDETETGPCVLQMYKAKVGSNPTAIISIRDCHALLKLGRDHCSIESHCCLAPVPPHRFSAIS